MEKEEIAAIVNEIVNRTGFNTLMLENLTNEKCIDLVDNISKVVNGDNTRFPSPSIYISNCLNRKKLIDMGIIRDILWTMNIKGNIIRFANIIDKEINKNIPFSF
jgi:predicted DNA-binding ArsR family transcriptional regulator